MKCRNCGTEIADKALICYRCGTATTEAKYKPVPIAARRRSWWLPLAVLVFVLLLLWEGAVRLLNSPAGTVVIPDPMPMLRWIALVVIAVVIAAVRLRALRRR
ncbi:MAG TPA: zinc ribbon domain-containing protein [Vicinamibacterales bacterium]|jgi:hypothetical protein|nr:zinc ribbon domain-containing protein [Vicinamibacterales bacterium]